MRSERAKKLAFAASVLASLLAVPARADGVPAAAQLLDATENPYTSTGLQVTVSNGDNMFGLANDGTQVFIINSDGDILTVPLAELTALASSSPGSSTTTSGTLHVVGWGGAAPSWPNSAQLSIAYSSGCIFMTSAEDENTVAGTIELYCIDVSDYSVTEIDVPGDHPLPQGHFYAFSNIIDFPDGRFGKVSRYEDMGDGVYRSTLRLYDVVGTGQDVTLEFSEDIIMGDTEDWAVDEHGLGTDGTYLYRTQWHEVTPNTKVWELASGATSSVVYSGSYTEPFGNMHYLSHNHVDNYYLVGHWTQNQFFISSSADPGPGPGNPLTPTFGNVASTTGGFTVEITNYDPEFDWSVESDVGDALAEYQAARGVAPAVGYFGAITRAEMRSRGLAGIWW
jgi:hypothetical protein